MYSSLECLTRYSSNSFLFNLYRTSFRNNQFSNIISKENNLSNLASLNLLSYNDIDNKEFFCLFILSVLNIIIGFFPNSVFYYVDFYVSDLIYFINY